MSTNKINVIFIEGDNEHVIEAEIGLSILDVAHLNKDKIYLEGACEGSLACATCHVILEQDVYDKLEPTSESEDDMLDLAFGLTSTSRLGCQIILKAEHDGMKIRLPSATRNIGDSLIS